MKTYLVRMPKAGQPFDNHYLHEGKNVQWSEKRIVI